MIVKWGQGYRKFTSIKYFMVLEFKKLDTYQKRKPKK